MPESAPRRLRIAFLLPYGEHREGFFPDTLLELCCAASLDAGHDAEVVRVYYDGHDPDRDQLVRSRLSAWLEDRDIDLVVAERLFDPEPVRAHRARKRGRKLVVLSWGDADVVRGVDFVVGLTAGATWSGRSRRSPSAGELLEGFGRLLAALSRGEDDAAIPGVIRVHGDSLVAGPPSLPAPLPRPFRPTIEHSVISAGEPPPITRAYLFGNAGCPFALDTAKNPHYANLRLSGKVEISTLGCAFCHAGGDYQKRPDIEVCQELVEQALYYKKHRPRIQDYVLIDQYPVRYLAQLVRSSRDAGLCGVRWLFASRADAFVKEKERLREAIAEAHAAGQGLDLYLSGFEAFCEEELVRYNKGVTVDELAEAVITMRQLAMEWPGAFSYRRHRGHSLILWGPWTSPANIAETARNVRNHGLKDVFWEMGRNRLRLYQGLPVYYAAERDGALVSEWQEGDEGAGRQKGYSVEQPWRFLDSRTRLAYDLASALRSRFGIETEIAQLLAIARYATAFEGGSRDVGDALERVRAGIERLDEAFGAASFGEAARKATTPAVAVVLGGACNNGCASCQNRDEWRDSRRDAVDGEIERARQSMLPIVLAGREPTMHPDFLSFMEKARGEDARPVGIVSNARRFAYPAFARSAVKAGLVAVSAKVFDVRASIADAIAGDEGAHEQTMLGLRHLRALGVRRIELRVRLDRRNLDALHAFADLATRLGVRVIRVELALDALGLDKLSEAADALQRLSDRCRAAGVALIASPAERGSRHFERMPL